MKIGFIGQGFIGKNYADDFEKRGYKVVRYSVEEKYKCNKEKIKECDIVFIAVPTPTTPNGFDGSIVMKAVKLVGPGKMAVIKSSVTPGLTEFIQKQNPKIFIFHSPEFLRAKNAAHDAANPDRNIVGIPKNTATYIKKAKEIIKILPKAPFELICSSREAELIKYSGNNFFYFKVVFINMLYDLAKSYGADWKVIKNALVADPRIGSSHLEPIHESGRGAGGFCFIKDFATLRLLYDKKIGDKFGSALLKQMENKNIELLLQSHKDSELLSGVYGKKILKNQKKKT
jgi:nucleotide sugar dehydrogenase